MRFESEYSCSGIIAGIDEVGRGCIAGPVVAACAIVSFDKIETLYGIGIRDSKELTSVQRAGIIDKAKHHISIGIGIATEIEIEEKNILGATKIAMLRSYNNAVMEFGSAPKTILVDGNFVPFELQNGVDRIIPVIKGDSISAVIGIASIFAKEARDVMMLDLHKIHPEFGWDKNKGYPTKHHMIGLEKVGVTQFHRKTFAPIKKLSLVL